MKRRAFLFGGLFGSGLGLLAIGKTAASEPGTIPECSEHEPLTCYSETPAISIMHPADPASKVRARSLVPCRKCGVLFALVDGVTFEVRS